MQNGRKRELGLPRWLRELFFAVVYGGWCVGKTALVLKLEKRHHLYFFMNPRKPPATCQRNAERR